MAAMRGDLPAALALPLPGVGEARSSPGALPLAGLVNSIPEAS